MLPDHSKLGKRVARPQVLVKNALEEIAQEGQ